MGTTLNALQYTPTDTSYIVGRAANYGKNPLVAKICNFLKMFGFGFAANCGEKLYDHYYNTTSYNIAVENADIVLNLANAKPVNNADDKHQIEYTTANGKKITVRDLTDDEITQLNQTENDTSESDSEEIHIDNQRDTNIGIAICVDGEEIKELGVNVQQYQKNLCLNVATYHNFYIHSPNNQELVDNAFLRSIQNKNQGIDNLDDNDLKILGDICNLDDQKLEEVALLIANSDHSKESVLFENTAFLVKATARGIHLIDKESNNIKTLVNSIIHPVRGEEFHKFVMRFKNYDKSHYLSFAKKILEAKFNAVYAESSGDKSIFIKNQLNMMVDGMSEPERDALLPLLKKKFNQISKIELNDTQIKITFGSDEVINFSFRAPTKCEYRGEILLQDINRYKINHPESTLEDLIIATQGTHCDSTTMYFLGIMRTQTVTNILGLKMNGDYDLATKDFLLSLNINGINTDTSAAYFNDVFQRKR